MEEIIKKKCSRCRKEKSTDEFNNTNKSCNSCIQNRKEYFKNNPEKVKETRLKSQETVITCPVCNYDIKKYKKSQHEKSLIHKYYSEKKLNNEEPERPDKIHILEGNEHFHCATCNVNVLPCMWVAHLLDTFHVEKKKAT